MNITEKSKMNDNNLAPLKHGKVIVSLNKDMSNFAVGSKDIIRIYRLGNPGDSDLELLCEKHSSEPAFLVCIPHSKLIAVVARGNDRVIDYINWKDKSIESITLPNFIRALDANSTHTAASSNDTILLYENSTRRLIYEIPTITTCLELSYSDEASSDGTLFAYPECGEYSGSVRIFNVANTKSIMSLNAQEQPIAALAFNSAATELATACRMGTVINVFSTKSGDKLFKFYRGFAAVSINSLRFSLCGEFVVTSSNTPTVHVFRLDHEKLAKLMITSDSDNELQPANSGSRWYKYFTDKVSTYVSPTLTNCMTLDRSFAHVTMNTDNINRICNVLKIDGDLRLILLSNISILQVHRVPENGGSCPQLNSYEIPEENFEICEF